MAISTVTGMGTTAGDKTSLQSSLAITGLASGMDWATIVTELANAERAPETQWESEQNTISNELSAYSTITSDLTTLQNDAETLVDPSFFKSVTASSSDTTVASATVDSGAPTGQYTFDISQLATAAQLNGTSLVSQVLDPGGDPSSVTVGAAGFSTPVTAGTFTVDGAQVTVATTDSLQDVFNAIATATDNKVAASYDQTTDKITLQSSDGSAITLGSGTDSSNFLQVAQLYNDNGGSTENTGTVVSASALGRVNTSATIASSDLKTAVTGDSNGDGQFEINGVTFSYNVNDDSIQDILNNINESTAGVTAAYDSIDNRFTLTNASTGDVGIAMKDVSGNFLAATGLSSGTLQHGQNLVYTLNGGSQQIESQSNTISDTSSGILGLTVTAAATGTAAVSVTPDITTISNTIAQFVTDYNTVQSYISSEETVTTSSDGGTTTPGTLTGDSNTSDIATGLRSVMSAVENITGTSGTVTQLGDIGFQTNGNDNTIALTDSTTLTSALQNNLSDVAALFSDSTNGLATQMNNFINATIGANGTLPSRTADLSQQSDDITTQISNLETKISNDSSQWDSEFQNMETAESQTNAELTYITQGVSSGSL